MSEDSASKTILSFDSALLECPICFKSYAEVDPTTFLCGHSCCIIDARKLRVCCLCKSQIPMPDKHTVSIALRDVALNLLQRKSSTDSYPKGILKVESNLRISPTPPENVYPSQQNTFGYLGARVDPMNSNGGPYSGPMALGPNPYVHQMGAYPHSPIPYRDARHSRRRAVHPPHNAVLQPFPPGIYQAGPPINVPNTSTMLLLPDGTLYPQVPRPCPYMPTMIPIQHQENQHHLPSFPPPGLPEPYHYPPDVNYPVYYPPNVYNPNVNSNNVPNNEYYHSRRG